MLKKLEFQDGHVLYDLIIHPDVLPYVRYKPTSYEGYVFSIKQINESEENGTLISRTILDEWNNPIGVISLYDIEDGCGFLGTWLGKPSHGLGYNQLAKEQFFHLLFNEFHIETIFMKIRKKNLRSIKAAQKIPYASLANEQWPHIYEEINKTENLFELYTVSKDQYTMHMMREHTQTTCLSHLKEA